MPEAPSGTVTFLFTDIEGSTRLWDSFPTEMSVAQAAHDELLRSSIAAHEGYVFSHAGDGVGASFSSPALALATAIDVQRSLASTTWPEPIDGVRVRMGMHTGTAEERDGDYFGTSVNRAARVAAAAHGGQVVVTDAVRLLVSDGDTSGLDFYDLGDHRLRDLTRPERLWQLRHPDLPDTSVELRTATTRTNIGPTRSVLLGRGQDIDRVCELVDDSRLVTLLGVGGVGKTKLARAVARQLISQYDGGAWFVDLAAVTEPSAVPAAIATTLGITERPGLTVMGSLLDALDTGRRLVIFDNAEHVVDATAEVTDAILSRPSQCALIVTSREPLEIEGERLHRVEPLNTGDTAVDLFRARARRVDPDLDLSDDEKIRDICRRLDGLPLAIELAAAQCDLMSVDEILQRLDTRSLSMRQSRRGTAARHASLDDTVRWSYEGLTADEQRLFDRLSVFAGGATLDAVRGICADDRLGEDAIADGLRTLVRKSMVVSARGRATRFSQLETLRAFAAARLAERGETDTLHSRHATWFAERSLDTSIGVNGPDEGAHIGSWLESFDDMRSAFQWATDHDSYEVVANLGLALPHLMAGKLRPELVEWAATARVLLPADHPGAHSVRAGAVDGKTVRRRHCGRRRTHAHGGCGRP